MMTKVRQEKPGANFFSSLFCWYHKGSEIRDEGDPAAFVFAIEVRWRASMERSGRLVLVSPQEWAWKKSKTYDMVTRMILEVLDYVSINPSHMCF